MNNIHSDHFIPFLSQTLCLESIIVLKISKVNYEEISINKIWSEILKKKSKIIIIYNRYRKKYTEIPDDEKGTDIVRIQWFENYRQWARCTFQRNPQKT